ncbi:MAG TPA: hypothetical protein VFG62_00640, partial [Rhodopila sp.]|nr:hypothetical protein [Rhodopila sp.]
HPLRQFTHIRKRELGCETACRHCFAPCDVAGYVAEPAAGRGGTVGVGTGRLTVLIAEEGVDSRPTPAMTKAGASTGQSQRWLVLQVDDFFLLAVIGDSTGWFRVENYITMG